MAALQAPEVARLARALNDNLAPSNGEGISPAPAIKAAGTAATKGLEGDAEAGSMPETKAPSPNSFSALKPFIIISVSYLLYTMTDGAIRMIVLLNAYNLGFTAWEVALMFTAYELAGVFTNLAAGMMGAKWGLKNTLLTGLSLQLVGISVLFAWQDSWSQPGQKWKAILFVTFAQMLCGIAKDLTKLGGKTVTKLITPDEKQSRLFKLVSLITGWKNSLKGVGYFIGAACVSFNYMFALGILLLLILLAMPWAIVGLSNQLGRARSKNLGLLQIFKQCYNVNALSVSRYVTLGYFLFGARDMWFEVPLPFFLRDAVYGLGWTRPLTGLFLALWIIIYGQVSGGTCDEKAAAVMITGLAAFCLVFAVNSSVHSYLIVKYADGDKVAMNIGFYYMANAMGRLTGELH
ncbi:hypothetical protein QJQ45_012521 [Haematococcus lacustris]|nr:hypothetical protein QJQ45_012521 [Haematococcus lacustris]